MTEDLTKYPIGRSKQSIAAALLAALLCLSATAQPQTITGKVVGVSDGDTLTVLDANKRQYKIRFNGVDSPEKEQDFYQAAKQNLSDLVFGKTVAVTWRKNDRYGRPLGKVMLGATDVNLEQARDGFAWYNQPYEYDIPPDDRIAYKQAEASARSAKRGLWAHPNPTPPWEFRKAQREGRGARHGNTVKALDAAPATGAQIIGNRNSRIYHLPNCPDYSKVSARNRVPFKSEAEAQAAGYRKAKNCP
jgi:endonuclease YncB( thermonuclease family)